MADSVGAQPSAAQILSGLPEAMMLVDSKHQLQMLNPAAESFLGTGAKNVIGRRVDDLIGFESNRLNRALTEAEASLVARRVEVRLANKRRRQVDFIIQNLPADPEWRIILLSPRTVETSLQMENDSHSGKFAVGAPDILGHEIKNPLAAIKGAAQLLDRAVPEEQKALTGMIQAEVERIAKLMDRMQGLSASQPTSVEPINVHVLIEKVRQSAITAAGLHLKIRDNFDPSLPDVMVDPSAMMQVLTNLLSNAVDATADMEDPEITVITRYSFGAAFSSSDDDRALKLPVEIIIRDNGPGIPGDLEKDIFSPFVTTKSEGQGLGLALVRKLMNDMNGRIRYERLVDSGETQFILYLPVAEMKS